MHFFPITCSVSPPSPLFSVGLQFKWEASFLSLSLYVRMCVCINKRGICLRKRPFAVKNHQDLYNPYASLWITLFLCPETYKRTETSGRVQSGGNKWSCAPQELAERRQEGTRVGLLLGVYQKRVDGVLSPGKMWRKTMFPYAIFVSFVFFHCIALGQGRGSV